MARLAEPWPAEKLERVADLLKTETIEGTCRRLSDEFGGRCTPDTLRVRADTAGIPWPGRATANQNNAKAPPWSEAKLKRLADLIAVEVPKREIVHILAKEFGVTHSKTTINRKAREMGIAVPSSQKLTDATARKAISHDFAVSNLKTHAETPKPPALLFAPECQFPIGEPRQPGFRLCSAQTPLGRPYCDRHYGLCYMPRFAQTS
jgi:GcrA cell cycle regulator